MRLFVVFILVVSSFSIAGSFSLVSDTLTLDVGSYRYIKFRVIPDQADSTTITGFFNAESENGLSKVEFVLITGIDYTAGWKRYGSIDTLGYYCGSGGEFSMEIPEFGDYILIISNRGNRKPIELVTDINVSFKGDGIQYDSLPFALTLLMIILASGVVFAAVAITIRKLR